MTWGRLFSRPTPWGRLSSLPMTWGVGQAFQPADDVGQAFQPADDGYAPLTVRGRQLHGCDHALPVASAQVKSALLLAGLYADGPTIVRQPGPARDHTERMLKEQIGKSANQQISKSAGWEALTFDTGTVVLNPALIDYLRPLDIVVPGDISSAAFPLVAAALVPGSEVTVAGVGVNPTRTGLLDVLWAMGGEVEVDGEREQGCGAGFPACRNQPGFPACRRCGAGFPACRNEPVADVTVRASPLRGVGISGDTVVRTIDEFPVLAVAATQAHGTTLVREAAELRVKESDRIAALVAALRALGARIEPLPDGFIVEGPTPLHGGTVDSHGDHRLAMALAVAGLVAEDAVVIERAECIVDSFPEFTDLMRDLGATVTSDRLDTDFTDAHG